MGQPLQQRNTPRRGRQVRRTDIDLTGGFRLDLKTLGMVVLLAGSWFNLTSTISGVRTQLDLQEKSRQEIRAAEREAEQARREKDDSERAALQAALNELKAQAKVTSIDVADLKVALATQNGGPK